MSKDTPEVGDVWLCEGGFKAYICNIENGYIHCFTFFREGENNCYEAVLNKKLFLKYHTYLGKSKANIDDLFKTENEE